MVSHPFCVVRLCQLMQTYVAYGDEHIHVLCWVAAKSVGHVLVPAFLWEHGI